MTPARYSSVEVVERGREIYERDIRSHVDPAYKGKLLAVDVVSGDYDIGDEGVEAAKRLRSRVPNAVVFLVRVGSPTAYKIGGPRKARQ